MNKRGKFITLEGSEGAGKSTNLATVLETLRAHGVEPFVTREPGGTDLAERLRNTLLENWTERVDGLSETLIVFAGRRQHVLNEIQPRLERGEWVLCDRFTDATYAYQGAARGVDIECIETLERWVQGTLRPDLTLYLDLDPQLGKSRIADREQDRLEQEQLSFFTSVREGYLRQAASHERIRVVDASRPLADVGRFVAAEIDAFMERMARG